MPMLHHYNDGGRKAAGYRGYTGDCVVRSICIVTGLSYKRVYQAVNLRSRLERGKMFRSSASKGVDTSRVWFKRYMEQLGFVWHHKPPKTWLEAATFGEGCYIVSMRGHYTAVVYGAVHDTYNPSVGKKKRVYGYWTKRDPLDEQPVDAVSSTQN